MRFLKLRLQNWRNFLRVDLDLPERVFLVGPNASGKSNLLDAFRFLRDVAETRGGFQLAVEKRGGVSKIRSLHARRFPDVIVECTLDLDDAKWRYRLVFKQDNVRRPIVKEEQVWKGDAVLLKRPDDGDKKDPGRLAQTHLEQVNANRDFREVAEFLAQVRYLHVVPQLIREPDRSVGKEHDPFGGDLLEQLARMQKEQGRTFASRLRRINAALRIAVPQLKELRLERDHAGRPHLRGLYEHWRPEAGWQDEDQFSDGTLRLIGLLWALLDGTGPLLLEEPELSLHEALIRHLPAMVWKVSRKSRRQVIMSTHSAALLSDDSIDAREVVLLRPTQEGTAVTVAGSDREIRALLKGGVSMGEAVLPRVAPARPEQLTLFPE
jgi:predicted ATPase